MNKRENNCCKVGFKLKFFALNAEDFRWMYFVFARRCGIFETVYLALIKICLNFGDHAPVILTKS